jgi:polar amino acid transport system permease protein
MVAASAALVLFLWLCALPLSWLPEPIGNNADLFAEGVRATVELTLISALAGLLLGIAAALGKLSRLQPLRWLCNAYIWVIRGTPLLIQVLAVYFALPVIAPWLQMSDFTSACVALASNVGAYNAEAMRGGLQAVPRGQLEAARALGFSRAQAFVYVTFPQAFKISLPSLVNNIVSLLKDSSLAYAIGVLELTNVGNRIQSATFQPVPVFAATAAIYLVLTTLTTRFSDALERRLDIEGRRP